jgi:Glycosyl hydrolases family 16
MAYTQLEPRHTRDSRVEEISRETSHYLLSIPAGKAGQYRLAQVDDYTQIKRQNFPRHPPLSLSLSARVSSESIPGTWGFGFWNDPFGLSPGFGGNPFQLPALPNAVWFFGASEASYLSFREGYKASGFLAQTFRSPKFHPLLILAGIALPFSRKMARRLLSKVIDEDGINLQHDNVHRDGQPPFGDASRLPVSTKVTDWHRYRLDWREKRVSFEVDDALIFESPVSPHAPLGLVIWIDNQYAAFTPEGRIGFGVLENPEPAWLEVRDIELNH